MFADSGADKCEFVLPVFPDAGMLQKMFGFVSMGLAPEPPDHSHALK